MLFKASKSWPETTEDRGHALIRPASSVSSPYFKVFPPSVYSRKKSKLLHLFFRGWTKKAERIQCPAPLPENPAIPLLTKMLVPAPYLAPEKKAKKKAKGARSGLRHKCTSDMTSEDAETHSAPATDEEKE